MEFNLETFVKDYIEALKELDSTRILALIDTLTDEQRVEAFDGVIKALEADENLLKDNPKMLETLEFVKQVAIDRNAAVKETNPEVTAEVRVKEPTASTAVPTVKAEGTVG